MSSKVDTIAWADMHPQFMNTVTDWLTVAEVPGFHPQQPNKNAGRGRCISEARKPFCEGLVAVFALVAQEFYHPIVA